MHARSKLEQELWEKLDSVFSIDGDLDLIEILGRLDNEEFLTQIEHDDFILGLSGVDEDAIDRIDRRREYLKELKRMKDKIKTDQEGALERWKALHAARTQEEHEEGNK